MSTRSPHTLPLRCAAVAATSAAALLLAGPANANAAVAGLPGASAQAGYGAAAGSTTVTPAGVHRLRASTRHVASLRPSVSDENYDVFVYPR